MIELKIQKQSAYEDGDCTKRMHAYDEENAAEMAAPYITLVGSASTSTALRCPNLGKYMASGVKQDGRIIRDACGHGHGPDASGGGGRSSVGLGKGSFNTLVVGCDDEGTMKFHSKCASEEPTTCKPINDLTFMLVINQILKLCFCVTAYTCHGNWEEGGTRYLIASPSTSGSRSPGSASAARRYCFIYTQTDGELRVSSSLESCRRNISPGISGSWAFNLTANGHCAERLTGDSSGSAAATLRRGRESVISCIVLVVFTISISVLSNFHCHCITR